MDTSTSNLLTLDQAAARLAVNTETVRRWTRLGRIPAYLLGGRYRISPSDLESFLLNNRHVASGARGTAA